MSAGWDDLLDEAQARLREQEDTDVNSELGDAIELGEGEHFVGRWRGVGQMQAKRGVVDVYLLWDSEGRWRFAYQHSRLVAEVNEVKPSIGDEMLILRGPTKTYEKDGEERSLYPYVVRARPCADPLPESPSESATSGQLGADEGMPFLWRGGHDPRSVRPAAAVTA